jgi:holliday junction DNA helicase RuvA
MINFLSGTVKAIGSDFVILLTNSGVGYHVFTTQFIVGNVKVGNSLDLFIETIVKENEIKLFGFKSYKEVVWFNSFIKISGVGAKIALLILSTFSISEIINALENQDKNIFLSIGGVGDKLATRLVNEMKKDPKKNSSLLLSTIIEGEEAYKEENIIVNKNIERSVIQEASMALENLGFNKNSINKIILKIFNENQDIKIEDLIKLTLKSLKD